VASPATHGDGQALPRHHGVEYQLDRDDAVHGGRQAQCGEQRELGERHAAAERLVGGPVTDGRTAVLPRERESRGLRVGGAHGAERCDGEQQGTA
jgi:hypothetical protein